MSTEHKNAVTVAEDGYFHRNGRRFVPIGVNYWPASCGVEMWREWPEPEMLHDLDVVRSLGLNCIRFFLRWDEFEPSIGRFDDRAFAHLEEFLGWCRDRGIVAQPTLFVGWMSGGIFWPDWKGSKNLFTDPVMIGRAAEFARRVSEVCSRFHDQLLGIDFGNEMDCLPDNQCARTEDIIAWCNSVSTAIRHAYPEALIVAGNDHQQVISDIPWPLGRTPGVNYLSMHGYPVPSWSPVSHDGMTDPLCQSLLPFYVKVARAFGPVLLQEFGTILTGGAAQQDAYLRALLPAAWRSGASGFLWWCLRDISTDVHPYAKAGFERQLGLVDADDHVKPGLEHLLEFASGLDALESPAVVDDAVGIYMPAHYYQRDNPLNPGNNPGRLAPRMVLADYLLSRAGYHTRIVRGELGLNPDPRTLLITGAKLTLPEVRALAAWVRAGGRLLWHGMEWSAASPELTELLGASAVDFRAPRSLVLNLFDENWSLSTDRNTGMELEPLSAQVLGADADGLPIVLQHQYGSGMVVYTVPGVEDRIVDVAGARGERDRWVEWYRGMLSLLESPSAE